MSTNRVCKLAKRPPPGLVTRDIWDIVDEPVPTPGPGQFRVKIAYISLDPAMRGWMNESKSYVAAVPLGGVMRGYAVGTIDVSNHPDFKVGDAVQGLLGVQSTPSPTARASAAPTRSRHRWSAGSAALACPAGPPISACSMSASRKAGETVVVSAASGAVGSLVGQIAKIKAAARSASRAD